jgi:CHAD domain-containing protein
MATNNLEIERKYDAPESVRLPDLHDLPGVGAVAQPVEHHLEATYFDTPELRLARHGITLRRRTGGADDGWHLKLPTPDGEREEIARPLGEGEGEGDAAPQSLVDLVRVHVRDHELAPVARIRTRRVVHRLLDARREPLAEVAEDEVSAESLGESPRSSQWREIEVELLDGSPAILDEVGKRLEAAGAAPSGNQAKLTRALGDRLQRGRPAVEGRPSQGAPAGEAVRAHLDQQVRQLTEWDPKARRDEPDAVHKMRVATRRLRSALATYRPLLDRTVTEPVRDELRWLGTALGGPRDAEVMRDRLQSEVREEPPELVMGGVARRIDVDLKAQHNKAHQELLRALDSDRYFRLLDSLDALVADPPFTDRAAAPGREVLPGRVARAWKRVRRLVGQADDAPDDEQRGRQLHEVRKAAKRARYAAESVTPVFGRPAKRFAKRMEAIQEVLGEHQDSVVLRDRIRQLGVQAHLAGENAFSFGRLHALEQERGARARRDFDAAWRAARRKKLRRWLR